MVLKKTKDGIKKLTEINSDVFSVWGSVSNEDAVEKVEQSSNDLTEINNLLEATEIDGITDNSNNSDDIISTETKQETANKIKTKELNLWG